MSRPRATRKRAYHHGDLRAALIGAAVQILERDGEGALTLREVAHRVGVSQAAPYHHFADKNAILVAVAQEGFVHLTAAIEDARLAAGREPRDAIRAICIAYVRFAVRHPSHFRVMTSGLLAKKEGTATLREAAQRAFGLLLAAVVAGQKAGVLVDGPPPKLTLFTWSMMHGLAMLHLNGMVGPLGPLDELVVGAAEAISRGLEKKTGKK
jgi:AcrR family transcriptional regulator